MTSVNFLGASPRARGTDTWRDPEVSPPGPREARPLPPAVAAANRRLVESYAQDLYQASAEEIMEWARRHAPGAVAVTLSMENTVLAELAARHFPDADFLFLDTGYHFAETLEVADELERRYPQRLVRATPILTRDQQDRAYGPDLYRTNPTACCRMRKVEPLARALRLRRLGHRAASRRQAHPRAGPGALAGRHRAPQDFSPGDLVAGKDAGVHRAQRAHRAPADAPGLPLDRVRDVHPPRRRRAGPARRALGQFHQDRMRIALMNVAVKPKETRAARSALGGARTPLPPHLKDLEAESIQILREAAGQFDNVALLFSGGKDSVTVFELARRAFYPARVPFELLHVDTGHNFPEVIAFRDALVRRTGARLRVAQVQDWIDRGELAERPDGTRNPLQTVPLVETIESQGYDAVLGGARRDEERARAKERVFSVRDAFGGWDPRRQRPELWDLYNGGHLPGENIRVFPISNWTESDVWEYVGARGIELPAIYFAHDREVFRRDGMWLTPGEWGGPKDGEAVQTRRVRYRTVGDMSCTGAVLSEAQDVSEVLAEIATSQLTERGATRADDRLSESAMEDRKKEGYF